VLYVNLVFLFIKKYNLWSISAGINQKNEYKRNTANIYFSNGLISKINHRQIIAIGVKIIFQSPLDSDFN
jgi:hypothetical protein